MKCPGQDSRFWDSDSIFEIKCPTCQGAIEFFKDDPFRRCPHCRRRVRNPRRDMGCAQHCPMADKCLEVQKSEAGGHDGSAND